MAGRAVMTTSMSRATMKNATDVSASVQGREPERGPALEAGAVLLGFEGLTSSCVFMVTPFDPSPGAERGSPSVRNKNWPDSMQLGSGALDPNGPIPAPLLDICADP